MTPGEWAEFHGSVDVMVAAYEDLPFSEFLHRPGAAADRLNVVRALRLRRHDAGDLALMRVDQMVHVVRIDHRAGAYRS